VPLACCLTGYLCHRVASDGFGCDPFGTMRGVAGESPTDATIVKLASNQALFREINERVGEFSDRWGGEPNEFVCECSRLDCHETMPLTHAEYEAVRRLGTHFLMKPGHEIPTLEDVVESNDRYVVVEKTGRGGTVATEADPRAQ
jgi:hypothetical protein